MSSFSIPPIKQSPLIGLEGFNGGAVSAQNLKVDPGFVQTDAYDNYEWLGDPIEVVGDWTQKDLGQLPLDRLFYLTFDMWDSPTTTKTIACVALVNSISGFSVQNNDKSGGDAFSYDGLPDGRIISLSAFANSDPAAKKTISAYGSNYNVSGDSSFAIDDNDCMTMNHLGRCIQSKTQDSHIPLISSSSDTHYANNFRSYAPAGLVHSDASPTTVMSNCIGHPEVSSSTDDPPLAAVYISFPAVEKAIYAWSGNKADGSTWSTAANIEGYKITDATQVTGANCFLKDVQNKYNAGGDTAYWEAFNHTTTQNVTNRAVVICDGIGSFLVGHNGKNGVVYHEVNYKTGQLVNSRTIKLPQPMGHADAANGYKTWNQTEEDCFGEVLHTVNATTFFGFVHGQGTNTPNQGQHRVLRVRFGGRDGWRHPDRAWLDTSAVGTDSYKLGQSSGSGDVWAQDQSGRDYIACFDSVGRVSFGTWGHDDEGIFGTSSSHNDEYMGFLQTTIMFMLLHNLQSGVPKKTFYTDTSAYG